MMPGHEPSAPCQPDRTFEVYSWPDQKRVLTLEGGTDGEARWAGNDALYIRGTPDPNGGTDDIVSLDGTSSRLPASIHRCCLSFSPDGRYVVMSAVAGEDCSLIDTATGKAVAGMPKGPGDTNDTGICQDVSWSPDGRYAIASGVSTP
jgi:WD40 repeat protein